MRAVPSCRPTRSPFPLPLGGGGVGWGCQPPNGPCCAPLQLSPAAGREGRPSGRPRHALDDPARPWFYGPNEHRRPATSVCGGAPPEEVAGAISSFSRSFSRPSSQCDGLSFVLCGVPSASFVRGSHEQDSLFPARRSEYRTRGGLAVVRSVEQFSGGASRLDDLIDLLDRRAGVVLSSGTTGCRAATRLDLGFSDPRCGW